MHNQEGSSFCFQEQIQQSSDEELLLALKEEIKRDNESLQTRLPIIEPKMDANMIVDMGTDSKNLNREMYAIMERTTMKAQ